MWPPASAAEAARWSDGEGCSLCPPMRASLHRQFLQLRFLISGMHCCLGQGTGQLQEASNPRRQPTAAAPAACTPSCCCRSCCPPFPTPAAATAGGCPSSMRDIKLDMWSLYLRAGWGRGGRRGVGGSTLVLAPVATDCGERSSQGLEFSCRGASWLSAQAHKTCMRGQTPPSTTAACPPVHHHHLPGCRGQCAGLGRLNGTRTRLEQQCMQQWPQNSSSMVLLRNTNNAQQHHAQCCATVQRRHGARALCWLEWVGTGPKRKRQRATHSARTSSRSHRSSSNASSRSPSISTAAAYLRRRTQGQGAGLSHGSLYSLSIYTCRLYRRAPPLFPHLNACSAPLLSPRFSSPLLTQQLQVLVQGGFGAAAEGQEPEVPSLPA